jgi:hypothetical protein
MKKLLIIPIILVIFSCSATKTTLTKTGKEDIGNLVGGLKEGKWNHYEYGRLIRSGSYSKNQRTGHWKYFHPNGKLHRKGKFINDKSNGFWKYYFENGQPLGEGKIINDENDGLWKWFYNNGNLYSEYLYDNGKLLEIKSCFDRNGGQLDCGNIINGNGIVISHDTEGKTDTVQHSEYEKGIFKIIVPQSN